MPTTERGSPPSQPSPSRGEGREIGTALVRETTRRAALTLIAGAASWPLVAHAQQGAVPVIGFLNGGSAAGWAHLVAAFRAGLADLGIVDGRDVAIEYRWAEGDFARLPTLAAELVARRVAVIAAGAGVEVAFAAKNATATIPIVFSGGADPVRAGLVTSLNHPEGNVTGISAFINAIGSKELDILHEMSCPATVGVLVSESGPTTRELLADVRPAAERLQQTLLILDIHDVEGIDGAFTTLAENRADAVYVTSHSFLSVHREQIVSLAARHAIPAIYSQREFTEIGGLISYGVNVRDIYRQLGRYAARILKGATPAELPVLLPTSFELVINLKTAKALGLDISPNLLAQADEVIE